MRHYPVKHFLSFKKKNPTYMIFSNSPEVSSQAHTVHQDGQNKEFHDNVTLVNYLT